MSSSAELSLFPFPELVRDDPDPYCVYVEGSMSRLDKRSPLIGGYVIRVRYRDDANVYRRFPLPRPSTLRCQLFGMLQAAKKFGDDPDRHPYAPCIILCPDGEASRTIMGWLRGEPLPRGIQPGTAHILRTLRAEAIASPVTFRLVEPLAGLTESRGPD